MSLRHALPLTFAALLAGAAPVASQSSGTLAFEGPDGSRRASEVVGHHGFAAVPADALGDLGWSVTVSGASAKAVLFGATELLLEPGSPYVRWNGEALQLADPVYAVDGRVYVPLQLLADFLPGRLGRIYRYEPARGTLEVMDVDAWSGTRRPEGAVAAPAPRSVARAPRASGPVAPEDRRVVVIDAGHGGDDLGARGRGGAREKDVALALALALARELADDPDLEVHLTRDADVFVPIWERGERATRWKGERPGVFVSLHANAHPSSRAARGFETFFLSEARTDHERRVAAIENAPLRREGELEAPVAEDPGLDFILKELRNFDHAHWSALLAEMVQSELAPVHSGPNRGVKQGPFAVITNALMPAVLVEIGFVTNREEERLLVDRAFQERAAGALARALRAFFARYPAGPSQAAQGPS